MIGIREAVTHCLNTVPHVVTESVPLEQAYGRILAEDVTATSPLPPWDNSAMDGFALRVDSTSVTPEKQSDIDVCAESVTVDDGGPHLSITETIAAGSVGTEVISAGLAARIMTGAPLPLGANAVVMREHATATGSTVQIHTPASPGQHVRRMGEDVAAGETVMHRGSTLTPAAVGLCAAVGRSHLTVARKPRVGLISTGDEIVPPGQPLGPGQIYSSNTHALTGLILATGAVPVDCGIAPDSLDETRTAFTKAAECDLIVSTGGVSVGDFDVVRQAMRDLGAKMQFWKVKIKPGKPLAFGVIADTPAFGLPGNPVSCQVGFLQFVRPWLRMAMGDPKPFLPVVQATLAHAVSKRAGRAELSRVVLHHDNGDWVASLTGTQGSGNQVSMVTANGLLLLSEDSVHLEQGACVSVQVVGQTLNAQADPGYPW